MSMTYETEFSIWNATERVETLIETYGKLIEKATSDKEEASSKEREYSEGIFSGQCMSYKMFIKDLERLKQDIDSIKKAMA